ncbi:MAG: HipA domain-containing protein [Actinomycetes bacterium]
MREELHAHLNGTLIGTITPNSRNRQRVRLVVSPTYTGPAAAVSEGFALIPGTTPSSESVSNFLGGYLPEGNQRSALAARIPGLRATDLFGMLRHYGVTMAGALSVRTDDPDDDITPIYRPLSRTALRKKLVEARDSYTLGNEPDSGRSTLAGFQAKLLLARFDGQWFHPQRGGHSTHILKPAPLYRPSLIADEHYSHEIARAMGLASFSSELVGTGTSSYLVISRYDRRVSAPFEVETFHQEDAAQALGLDWTNPASKFQDRDLPNRKDRPSCLTIAELFGSIGASSQDAQRWFQYLVYSVLVGNHDAHAKNVSILHDGGSARIADLYDAVPILHINDDPQRRNSAKVRGDLSLAIAGEFGHQKITRRDMLTEATSWGVFTAESASSLLDLTFEQFGSALETVSVPRGASEGLRDRLGYNLDNLIAGKSIGKPKLPIRSWTRREATSDKP